MNRMFGNANKTITKNAVRCHKCGTVAESKHRHDFVSCFCGDISVDGGFDYLRRVGNLGGYEDLSEYEEDMVEDAAADEDWMK